MVSRTAELSWARRVRFRYDQDFRLVLEEEVDFDDGEERVARRVATAYTDDRHFTRTTEHDGALLDSSRYELDASGRVLSVESTLAGSGEVFRRHNRWPEGWDCEMPQRSDHGEPLADGRYPSWVESTCDAHGRLERLVEHRVDDGDVVTTLRTVIEPTEGGRALRVRDVQSGGEEHFRFDSNGNVVSARRVHSAGEEETDYDFGCWSFEDGTLGGGPSSGWFSLEAGSFLRGLEGRWRPQVVGSRNKDSWLEIGADGRTLASSKWSAESATVLTQTEASANLQLADGTMLNIESVGPDSIDVQRSAPGTSPRDIEHLVREHDGGSTNDTSAASPRRPGEIHPVAASPDAALER